MSFGAVLASDEGIPARPAVEIAETLGETQPPFTANAHAALAYSAHVHREQSRRRGAAPYISHLVAVAALVAEDGGGETELIGALLHDAAEDHGGERRLRDIELRFGAGVAQIVRALSDSLEPDGSPREPWRERKQRYVDALRDETDAGILRVSNADKLDNARGRLAEYRLLGAEMWDRRLRSRDEQLWYYRELAAIFSARRPESILASEFAATIAELERT
jgi:(p)ppGpp synthase/HD superfamily hydrolase